MKITTNQTYIDTVTWIGVAESISSFNQIIDNSNNKISKIIDDHLKQLRIKRLYALYLHRPDDLFEKVKENLILALNKLKKEKKFLIMLSLNYIGMKIHH